MLALHSSRLNPWISNQPFCAGLVEQLVDCSGGAEITEESGVLRKLAGLDRALRQHRAQRTVVFCNKIETCRKVWHPGVLCTCPKAHLLPMRNLQQDGDLGQGAAARV